MLRKNDYFKLAKRISENMTNDFFLCQEIPNDEYLHLFEPDRNQKEDDSEGWFNSSYRWIEGEPIQQGNQLRVLALLFMHEMSKD